MANQHYSVNVDFKEIDAIFLSVKSMSCYDILMDDLYDVDYLLWWSLRK